MNRPRSSTHGSKASMTAARLVPNAALAAPFLLVPAPAKAAEGAALWSLLSDAMTAEEMAALSLTLALIAFSVIAAILYLRTRDELGRMRGEAHGERARLAARAERAESLLRADRQIIVAWIGDDTPEVYVEAGIVPDAPGDADAVLNFSHWLASESAERLEHAVAKLRIDGAPFDMVLGTSSGAAVEADGRAAGGRAVLRMRDITGQRRDFNELRERQLKASRDAEAMRNLFDTLDLPAWLRDDAGNMTWVSEAFARLAGASSPDEAVAEKRELATTDALASMAEARRALKPYRGEIALQAGEDNRRLNLNEVPLRTGSAGLAFEADANAQLEAALQREADIRAEILDRIDTAVAVFDNRRRLTFCNKAYRDLWQLDDGFLATQPDFDELLERWRGEERIPALPDGMDYRQWRSALTGNESVGTHDWDLPNASLSLKLVTIPHRDGGSTHMFHDLTENIGLQTRMRAQARVQRQTLEGLSEAIAVFGQNGKLKLSNPRFATMWQIDGKSLENEPHIDDIMTACEPLLKGGDDWLALKQTVCGFLDARAPMSRTIDRRDGLAIALSTVPLSDGATLAVFTDVTASKTMERALRERNEALEQAAELRSNFVSNVSYHLRDPLQTIIGFAQLLSDSSMSADPARQAEYAGYIFTSSTSLMAIVNDILDLASIDADVLELDLTNVDLADAINTAAEALRDRVAEKQIDLTVTVPPEAGSIEGDLRRIRQILFGLIANAVAHSDEGDKIDVSTTAEDDSVAIRIADTGQGIPARYLGRVFDSFETRAGDQQKRARGPGLGLSLAKGFVEKHGGSIEIESEPGKGTTVTCRLPMRQAGTVASASLNGEAARAHAQPHA